MMKSDQSPGVGQKGRFYFTKHLWVPQEPLEKLNLKMSDMILRNMPQLPLRTASTINESHFV